MSAVTSESSSKRLMSFDDALRKYVSEETWNHFFGGSLSSQAPRHSASANG